jgi:hypothetical protein
MTRKALTTALDYLADLIENGRLLESMDGEDFIVEVADEIRWLRAENERLKALTTCRRNLPWCDCTDLERRIKELEAQEQSKGV